jgi:hypothetical protein
MMNSSYDLLLHSIHLGVTSLTLTLLCVRLFRTPPERDLEHVLEGGVSHSNQAKVQLEIRKLYIVTVFWWGVVNQVYWILFSLGVLPTWLNAERFFRLLSVFVAQGVFLNLRLVVRFAALGVVLLVDIETTAPCLMRFVSHYYWVMQLLLLPLIMLVFTSDLAGHIAVQVVYGALAALHLGIASYLISVNIRLSRSALVYRRSVRSYRLGVRACAVIALFTGFNLCFILSRSIGNPTRLPYSGGFFTVCTFILTHTFAALLFCRCGEPVADVPAVMVAAASTEPLPQSMVLEVGEQPVWAPAGPLLCHPLRAAEEAWGVAAESSNRGLRTSQSDSADAAVHETDIQVVPLPPFVPLPPVGERRGAAVRYY